MNEANEFYEDMQRREAVLNWRSKSTSNADDEHPDGHSATHGSEPGNGEEEKGSGSAKKKDGTPSPEKKDMNLTPNG